MLSIMKSKSNCHLPSLTQMSLPCSQAQKEPLSHRNQTGAVTISSLEPTWEEEGVPSLSLPPPQTVEGKHLPSLHLLPVHVDNAEMDGPVVWQLAQECSWLQGVIYKEGENTYTIRPKAQKSCLVYLICFFAVFQLFKHFHGFIDYQSELVKLIIKTAGN